MDVLPVADMWMPNVMSCTQAQCGVACSAMGCGLRNLSNNCGGHDRQRWKFATPGFCCMGEAGLAQWHAEVAIVADPLCCGVVF